MIYVYFIIICGLFFVGFVDWKYVFGCIDSGVDEDLEIVYESIGK